MMGRLIKVVVGGKLGKTEESLKIPNKALNFEIKRSQSWIIQVYDRT